MTEYVIKQLSLDGPVALVFQVSHSLGNLENSWKFVNLENCWNFLLDLEFLV